MTDNLEYGIGRFTLKPFRQLSDAGGPVAIGRKPLELLSVLAKAEGALVTKDELMAAVWPNVIVEDNAIQVHVAALRKALGTDAGLLSTVHGLGYRLTVKARLSPVAPSLPRRWTVPIAMVLLSIVALAAAGLWLARDRLTWPHRLDEARIAVVPFDIIGGSAKELHHFADGLRDEIVSQLSDSQIPTDSPAGAAGRLGAGMVLDGTVQGDGKVIDVRVHLNDVQEHVVLWSSEFHGSADATEALQAKVAAQVAEILYSAKIGRSGRIKLDAASLAAFIAGRASIVGTRNRSMDAAEADNRKVVAARPDFSWGHSGVAATEVFELREDPSRNGGDSLRADARSEAKRALALDPHNGEAWMALEYLVPLSDWRGRENLLIQGITADPNFEPIVLLEGRLLWNVGRGHDALPWFRRAHAIDPLRTGDARTLALGLASQGLVGESRAVVARMVAQWPDHYLTRDVHFWTSVIAGATDDVLAQLADPGARPDGLDQRAVDAWTAALKARDSKDQASKLGAAKAVTEAASTASLRRGQALTLLAMLGDLDGAFAQAEKYEPVDPSEPAYLFLPATASMRSDPRFMDLAQRLGLAAYWRGSGHWPDFCADPGLPYDCRTEASRRYAAKQP